MSSALRRRLNPTKIWTLTTWPWQTLIEAVRNADLLLVHLSDPKELARRLS
jgi:hypothetical protein